MKIITPSNMKFFNLGFLILLFAIIASSCKHLSPSPAYKYTIPLDPDENKTVNIEDIADTFFFKKLNVADTSIKLRQIKMYASKSKLYIVDMATKKVFIFNKDGMLKSIFDKKGMEKDQYVEASDIYVDINNDQINVWDNKSKRIMIYDSLSHYIKSFEANGKPGMGMVKNRNNYFFDRYNIDFDGSNLATYKIDGDNLSYVRSEIDIPKPLHNLGLMSFHSLDQYKDSLFYLPNLSEYIYYVSPTGSYPMFKITAKNYRVVNDTLLQHEKFRDLGGYSKNIIRKHFLFNISDLFVNQKYVSFRYSILRTKLGGSTKTVFFSKKDHSVLETSGLKLKNFPATPLDNMIIGKDGEYFVAAVYPYNYHDIPSMYMNQLPPEIRQNINNKALPLLLYYKLK